MDVTTKRYSSYVTMIGVAVCLYQLFGTVAKAADSPVQDLVAVVQPRGTSQAEEKNPVSFSGNISWYGPYFHGKKTASGEIFDMNKPTAAHLSLPFGTRVLVEDPRTGKTVIVKVNDRGPYVRSRVMDLAREGARRLGTLLDGVAFVDCLIIN